MDEMLRGDAAERPVGTDATSGKSDRLVSLDAFRGLTVAFMVLVSNPGSLAIYRPLDHSPWNGWTITDVVFPSFLWIVGVAITLSLGKRLARGVSRRAIFAQACRRALILYALGLLIYAIPNFSLATLRLLGVLQRIAICYLVGTALYLTMRLRTQVLWLIGILLTYWLAMKLIPVPGFGAGDLSVEGNFAHYVDHLVLGRHNYVGTGTWDPEGIVSTLPAIATTLFGMIAGRMLALKKTISERVVWLFFAGNVLLGAGVFLELWMPINKKLWTDPFCLLMAGMDFVIFAMFLWVLDGLKAKWRVQPLLVFGKNALAIYMVSELVSALLYRIHAGGVSLHEWIFRIGFEGLGSPATSSLLYAIAYLAVMFGLGWFLNRKQWFLKI
jgi:predicted acyltransferase